MSRMDDAALENLARPCDGGPEPAAKL